MKRFDFDNIDLAIFCIAAICIGFSIPHLMKGGAIGDIGQLIGQCVLAIAALATGKKSSPGD